MAADIIKICDQKELDSLIECFETLCWKSSVVVDHDHRGMIYYSPNSKYPEEFKNIQSSHLFPINVTAVDKFEVSFRDGLNFISHFEGRNISVEQFLLDHFRRRYYILL